MNATFVDVVEDVKKLTIDEKEELRDLIDSYLVEERRSGILVNYDNSKSENLSFSSNIDELMDSLND